MPTLDYIQVNIGTSITGSLEGSGASEKGYIAAFADYGWFEVTLVAGQSYTLKLEGSGISNGLFEPYLELYDSNGIVVASYSDGGGLNTGLTYTVTTSGMYFIGAYVTVSDVTAYDAISSYALSFSISNTNASAADLSSTDGGLGNDTYYVYNIGDTVTEYVNEGTDTIISTIDFDLSTNGANVENLTLSGKAFNATGNELDNILIGNTAANTLIGNEGDDTLDGGKGADTMTGGLGNDTYYVDNKGDIVIEDSTLTDEIDTVHSKISYTLAANVENLILDGTASNKAYGNNLNNTLTGNKGNNLLDGGLGADTMIGGLGKDTYYVDNTGDILFEDSTLSTEVDTVISTITYALTDNVENLTLIGTDNIDATGNSLKNKLTGNSGNNILDGGEGIDTMTGGLGNDTYYVDNIKDKVIEKSKLITEIDTVISSIDYTLGNNLENLTLSGTAVKATGNKVSNEIIGNDQDNILNGKEGNDLLFGGAGNDILEGGAGNDVLEGGEGIDTAIFKGNYSSATISYSSVTGDFTISTAKGGTDILRGIEILTFSDQSVTSASLMSGSSSESIIQPSAAAYLGIGSSSIGSLSLDNEQDYFSVNLTAGQTYSFIIESGRSGSLDYPDLKLYDMNGTLLLEDGLRSTVYVSKFILTYEATESGTHYLSAGHTSFSSGVGTYIVSATDIYLIDSSAVGEAADSGDYMYGNQIKGRSYTGDGRYFTFSTIADNLSPNDTNGNAQRTDIFVKDLKTGAIDLIAMPSVKGNVFHPTSQYIQGWNQGYFNPSSEWYDAETTNPMFSSNGRYIAFDSNADSLVPIHYFGYDIDAGDINAAPDVYIKDLITGEVKLVSADINGLTHSGISYLCDISADGRYVLFNSSADLLNSTALIYADGVLLNPPTADTYKGNQIYMKDMQTGEVQLISSNSLGNSADRDCSYYAKFSADGQYVVFVSNASNLVADTTVHYQHVFLKNLVTNTVQLVNSNSEGIPSIGDAFGTSVSSDGRYVAFVSTATDLAQGNDPGYNQVFVKDMQTGSIRIVSSSSTGIAGNGSSTNSAEISADGRYVTFSSASNNLTKGDEDNGANFNSYGEGGDVFVKDLQTDAIVLVAKSSIMPFFTSDGKYITIETQAALVSSETDVYIHEYRIANPFLGSDPISIATDSNSPIMLPGTNGADSFRFAGMLSSTATEAIITDFTPGEDTIVLVRGIYDNLSTLAGDLIESNFSANASGSFISMDNNLSYNTSTGVLSYDVDGNGTMYSPVPIVTLGLSTHPIITSGDILVSY